VTIKPDNSLEKLHIKIGGMQCSFCTGTINQALTRMNGVHEVGVSLAHEEALIQYNPSLVTPIEIQDTLRDLGFKIRDPNKIRSFEEEELELYHEKIRLYISAVLTLISLIFMVFMWIGIIIIGMPFIMASLALITMFGPGWHIKRMAFASLRRRIFNQHVLLEFAAFGGLFGGVYGIFNQPWPTADFFAVSVFVTSYHILSGYVSLFVRTRSSQAIKKLMELQPATARVIEVNGNEEEVPIELVKLNDNVRVRAGESIPVDGIVSEGVTMVDQSLVTGESIPILKKKGDEVIGGSINQKGTLLIKVSKIGKESFLQQIAQHIQEARALKPGIVMLIDKVLKYFVRVVILAAILAFLIWTIGLWIISGDIDLNRAILSTLAVLVMGYPCALGMATPLAMIRGGGIAAQKGILMRSGEAFQTFKDVKIMVFDKTGTLTVGKPQIVEVISNGKYTENGLLTLAASIEIGSDHPLGKALVDYSLKKGIKLQQVEDFHTFPGQGVRGFIQDSLIIIGNSRFLAQQGVKIEKLNKTIEDLENQGLTLVYISENKELEGIIALGDKLKDDALETIDLLYSNGFEPIMITGDNSRVANAIAKKLCITEVLSNILPQDKARKIRELQSHGYKVAMVGDGINDAPALTQADVGIAIGAGTDIAIESADIILIGDHLKSILDAYSIGKSSYKKTKQNTALAFGFNAIGLGASVAGLIHPIWAMIAMALSVTTVLLNSFSAKVFHIKKH